MDDHDGGGAGRDDVSPGQLRAARSLLGWSLTEAGREAGISVTVVLELERARRDRARDGVVRLVGTYEAAGVTFHSLPDGSTGLTWRPK